jgi:tRNA (guanine-N7-)-methyltransferase
MKPKDLKFPFTWEERKPFLGDKIFFIPNYYDNHNAYSFPLWRNIFGNDYPVFIEYCSGNGAWIIEKAKDITKNFVAVEIRFDRARKIWSKIKNLALDNVFVVCGEGLTFTKEYLTPQCIDGVFVNYPDPWPKKKHAKNRLFQPPFVEELYKVIRPQGVVTVVTDDSVYGCQIIDSMLAGSNWISVFPPPYFITNWNEYGFSYFDSLWREKGKTIHYFQFKAL